MISTTSMFSLLDCINQGSCGPQRNAWNVPCRSLKVVGVGSFVVGGTSKREKFKQLFRCKLAVSTVDAWKANVFLYRPATCMEHLVKR